MSADVCLSPVTLLSVHWATVEGHQRCDLSFRWGRRELGVIERGVKWWWSGDGRCEACRVEAGVGVSALSLVNDE